MTLGIIITIVVCIATLIGSVCTSYFVTKKFNDIQSKYLNDCCKDQEKYLHNMKEINDSYLKGMKAVTLNYVSALNERLNDIDKRLTEHLENENVKNDDDDCK